MFCHGLYATPCGGVAPHALGLWWCTETKAIMMLKQYFICLDLGMAQKTLNCGSKERLYKNEHTIEQ